MSDIDHLLTAMQNSNPELYKIYKSVARGLEWVWQFRNRDYGWGPTPQSDSSLETTYWVVKNLLPITSKKYFIGTKEYVMNLTNPEGFWGDIQGAKSTYRHTSCAISLLNFVKDEIEEPQIDELIEKGKDWLISGSYEKGGWGLGPDDPHDFHNSYIISTALLDLDIKPEEAVIQQTAEWLKASQMANGAWPLHADRISEVDIENSAKGYIILNQSNFNNKESYEKVINFILKNQNDDGGWGARPGLETDIVPTAYAFTCLTKAGYNYLDSPEQISKTIDLLLSKQDRVGSWSRKGSRTGSVGITSFLINALYSQIQQTSVTIPVSAVFQVQIPSLTGRTVLSRKIKSPVRDMAQIIWQLEGEEHYDIFLDSPETENILFTHSRHFVPLEVRKDIVQRTLEINDLFNALQKIGDWSRTGAAVDIYEELYDNLTRLGKGLYFDFVPSSLQNILSTISTRYLMIATNDPLIPWELIYLPEKETFLGLEFALGRKVLMVADRLPLLRKSFDNVLHVLLIGNPSGNLPSSEEEVKYIAEKLESNTDIETKVLVGEDVTRTSLEKTLSEQHYDIMHFAGHSYYNADNPNKSYLELSKGEAIYASQFSWLFQKGIPSIIFLNACSTARVESEECSTKEGQMSGIIRQLMNIGVQSVIGSLWEMHDIISATIATEFYRNLMQGMNLGEALQAARKIVYNSFKQRNVGWNGFILYGNPMLKLE